jgi:hypothetical protein
MNSAEQLIQLYHQCATDIKKDNRCLGPLQIHHESLQRLAKQPSFIEYETRAEKKKKNGGSSWKVDPILAIRSIIAPRRTNCKDELSKIVLPGRRITVDSDSCGSGSCVSKMRKHHQDLELEGLSDLESDTVRGGCRPRYGEAHSDSDLDITIPNQLIAVQHEFDVKQPRAQQHMSGGPQVLIGNRRSTLFAVDERRVSVDNDDGYIVCGEQPLIEDTPIRPHEMLGMRRSTLFAVDERRASVDVVYDDEDDDEDDDDDYSVSGSDYSTTKEVLRRRASMDGRVGTSLICEFPSRNTSSKYIGNDLICGWGRRNSV